MNRSTQIWVGVVVLAGLAGLVAYKAKEDQKIGTAQTTNADLPELKVEEPDKISIKNGDKPEIVLAKKDDKWMVEKPVEAPANQDAVKSLVSNLKDLKAKEVIVSTADEASKKDYDFVPEKQVHVVAEKGGEKKLDVTFGKSGARGQMAMLEGKDAIYGVSGYSSYLYTREVKGFRDTEIFKFDDANVNQMTIANKNGAFSFTKDGDNWAGTFKGRPIPRFDADKVKDAVRTFKSLTADEFGDGKDPKEIGLAEPAATVTIQLKDNAGKYVLKVGDVSNGTSHWAMKDGSDTVYSIASYQADWALAEESKFQKPADAGADADKKAPSAMPGMGASPHGE